VTTPITLAPAAPGAAVPGRWAQWRARARSGLARAERSRVAPWLGPLMGLAMLALLVVQVGDIGWAKVAAVWPSSPWFYLLFAAFYWSPVVADVTIYRRLWGVGWSDWPMFARKRVMNEALLGYSGEAYSLLWARSRPGLRHPPFAAVKDVNLLSGLVGNIATFGLLALTLLMADGARMAEAAAASSGRAIAVALAVLAAVIAFVALKPRLFSLPTRERWWITGVHVVRFGAGVLCMMTLWSIALPGVAWGVWLALAAWRNFIQRLPFVPNKDLLFVNLAILTLGAAGREVAALLALTAALTVVAHALTALLTAPRPRMER
jgi:hypothetical protein